MHMCARGIGLMAWYHIRCCTVGRAMHAYIYAWEIHRCAFLTMGATFCMVTWRRHIRTQGMRVCVPQGEHAMGDLVIATSM